MLPSRPHVRPSHRAPSPRGFVLVIALIMLGVVGLISTASIRLALSGDTAAQAMRSNNATQQAAEAALRWCELQVRQAMWDAENGKAPVFTVWPAPDTADAKMKAASLKDFGEASTEVPLAVLNNAGLVAFPTAPRCVAQRRDLGTDPGDAANLNASNVVAAASPQETMNVVQITARAFSPDFNNTARSAGGGDVWIQSTLIVLKYAP